MLSVHLLKSCSNTVMFGVVLALSAVEFIVEVTVIIKLLS